MKRTLPVFAALVLAAAFAFAAMAEEKSATLEGSVLCAKCSLHEKDRTACQNVLQVKGEKGEMVNYYITKNDVAEKFGHVCKGSKSAKVTGTVTEKDGQKWIEASKMEETKSS